ncbi:MAG: hypothetical protein NTW16_14580 [Bacteroidetes bacterium]|nr:hypothetical protein [Bacteroidota bacterium]
MNRRVARLAVALISGWILFSSCNNSGSTMKLKDPATEQAETGVSRKTITAESPAVAKEKTIDNLLAACNGETTASAKYAAYSKKAEQQGFHQIAILFSAVSAAEKIHYGNHKAVLEQSGIKTVPFNPEFTVKSTMENLQDAIKGETYVATAMYPEFLKIADEAGNQMAILSLNYAFKTEKKHRVMFENALAALENNTVKSLSAMYYVCATCGNTYDAAPPQRCGICMTGSEKFIKIN